MFTSKEQSLIDHILKASLELARMKKRNTYKTFQKMNDKCRPHRLMTNLFKVSSHDVSGRKVWTLAPKDERIEQHVFFLHGGAYVVNMTPVHWFFIGAIIQKLHCTVIVPDYPLLPDYNVEDVFEFLPPVYEELLNRVGASRITLMGDSAGGGMALAFSHLLNEKKMAQPSQLFLLSPWLDVSMNNPDIVEYDPLDPILNVQGLIDCGNAYAGDMDRSSPLVSPLFAPVEGLPETTVFVGTHEVMLPDVRKFKKKAEASGVHLDYHEINGLIHDGMLYPTPEGKLCRKQIFDQLKKKWTA